MRHDLKGDVTKLKAQVSDIDSTWARIASFLPSPEIRFRCMESKTEKKLMSEAAILEKIASLSQTVARLQERLEDLEDLRDLEEAIRENDGKPLIPLDEVKAELELD